LDLRSSLICIKASIGHELELCVRFQEGFVVFVNIQYKIMTNLVSLCTKLQLKEGRYVRCYQPIYFYIVFV